MGNSADSFLFPDAQSHVCGDLRRDAVDRRSALRWVDRAATMAPDLSGSA